MSKINLTQYVSKETALYCLVMLYKYGMIHGNYTPVYNSDTHFWELREG